MTINTNTNTNDNNANITIINNDNDNSNNEHRNNNDTTQVVSPPASRRYRAPHTDRTPRISHIVHKYIVLGLVRMQCRVVSAQYIVIV